jgi:signal transduction histidine kinase
MTNENFAYNRRLERLLEASRLLNSTLEVGELTEIVLHIVQDEVPVDRCTLYVLDRRQNVLRSFVAQGIDKSEITVPVGEGLAGAVAATRQPIDVTDVYEDERFRSEYDNVLKYKTRDVYSIPVFNRVGNLIGVLQLLNRKKALHDADKEFLASICTYIGLALQNAWDHRELIEARKMEQELVVVRDRLAEAQKLSELSELVTGIIHEMRNPLSVAVGQSNLLREQAELPETLKPRVQKIEESITRAVKIAQNFLNFARHGESQPVPTDINNLVTQTVDLVSYDIRMAGIELSVELQQIPNVNADGGAIQQVLLNLLRNAQHALGERKTGGKLCVRTAHSPEEGKVRIELSDDGPGIPDSVQQRIFEPFFTTKPKGLGTGLGLAVSRRIMQQHRGSLTFESAPGLGTTFRIELPVSPAREQVGVQS